MRVLLGVGIVVAMMAVTTVVEAQDLTQGRQEIALSGFLEVDTPSGTDWNLGGGYGYFIRDSWEVGGMVQISDNDIVTTLRLGATTEYNFLTETEWVPYVGVGILWGQVDPDIGDREDAAILNPYFGLKYFISNDVSLFGQADFEMANTDLYVDENANLKDTNWSFQLGVRFYM